MEICVSKSIRLALQLKVPFFALFYFVFDGNIPSTSPRGQSGGIYFFEGRFIEGFFALPVWEAYIWRGLYTEGLIFEIFRIFKAAVTST